MKEAKQIRTIDDWMNDIWKRKPKLLIGILSLCIYQGKGGKGKEMLGACLGRS